MDTTNLDINLSDNIPEDETGRQYYYIEKARLYVQELSQRIGRPLTFCVTTFGCQMNARDSEKLRGILKEIGYLEAEEETADFVIYNTCTVRGKRQYPRVWTARTAETPQKNRIRI